MAPPAVERNNILVTRRMAHARKWPQKARTELVQLLRFCWRPTRRHPADVSMSGITWRMATILLAYLVPFTIVLVPVLLGVAKLLGMESALRLSGTELLIASVVFAPLLEELVFRAGLRSATMTLAMQPVLIALLFGKWQVALVLSGVVALVALIDYVRQRRLDDATKFSLRMARGRVFINRYRTIVWGYAIAFGLVHMGNFTITTTNGLLACLAVLIVSSQMFLGLLLSYFRLRYGLLSAMGFHALWNLTYFLADKVVT